MAENPYVPIVTGVTTGGQAATQLNILGSKVGSKSFKIASEFAEIENEVGFWEYGTVVYCVAEESFYQYDLATENWLPVSLGNYADLTTENTFAEVQSFEKGIVLPKTISTGIKVDTVTPTFGWRDMLGAIETRPASGLGASTLPDFVQYRGTLYAYRFGTLNPNNHLHEVFVNFHLDHDYVPSTDIYIHFHWSQIVVDTGGGATPGVSEWMFDISYAKGHGIAGGVGDPFIAPKTITVTQQASTTQYAHMIAEVVISGATDTATTFARTVFEPDGILMVRGYRDPTSTNDTLNQDTFVHFLDCHYQSTGIGTKNKAPSFYGA